jgi:TATA-box binding protein (TBP) (component of TFIID and TFIIIB)
MDYCIICDPKSKYDDCICNENFSYFYDIYNELNNITSRRNVNIIKKWSISTMTICCKFNSEIDLQKYRNEYEINNNKKSFYNSINIYSGVKYQFKNKVSIKIFTNGNIQLAGILNVMSATYAIRKMFKRIYNINAFNEEKKPYISDVRICMINSDFKIDKNIKQSLFCDHIESSNYNFINRYSFNPSKYPGINLKVFNPDRENQKEIITCSIFRPGSIIITGGNNIKSYKFIFNKLLFILENNSILC